MLMPIFIYFGAFLPSLAENIFSTQGIMIMLLAAYGVAMWMFLTSAPKVYTVMVSDLDIARQFYEGLLDLPIAEIPLQYYYNYEQTLGTTGIDPLYIPSTTEAKRFNGQEGLWYQLKKNSQLHIIGGASLGKKNHQRHVCFERDCLENLLMKIQARRLKYKIRQQRPLNFLVKDIDNRIIEIGEISN